MKDKIDEIMGLVDDVVENAELLAKSSKHYAAFCASKKTIESKLRELEKDAARYRWLRERDVERGVCILDVGEWVMPASCIALNFHSSEAVDCAIDAAMQKD